MTSANLSNAGRDALRKALGTLAPLNESHWASVDGAVVTKATQTGEAKLELMTQVRLPPLGYCHLRSCPWSYWPLGTARAHGAHLKLLALRAHGAHEAAALEVTVAKAPFP